jgi:hypothetical protein
MNKIIHFFSGFIAGVYISQNYQCPNINNNIKHILKQISYYEKNK